MSRSRFSEQSPPVFSLWGYSKATLYGSVAFATVALMIRSGSGCRTLLFSPRFTWICKVKYFVGFAVSLVFSLSLDSTLESRFLRAWCCLLWPIYHQNYKVWLLLIHSSHRFSIRRTTTCTPPLPCFSFVGISRALLGGDYCQSTRPCSFWRWGEKGQISWVIYTLLNYVFMFMTFFWKSLATNLPNCSPSSSFLPSSSAFLHNLQPTCALSSLFKLYPDSESGLISSLFDR